MNKDEEESEFVYTLSISGIDKHSVTIIIDKRGRNQGKLIIMNFTILNIPNKEWST